MKSRWLIVFGFLGAILLGAFLFMLPVSSTSHTWMRPMDESRWSKLLCAPRETRLTPFSTQTERNSGVTVPGFISQLISASGEKGKASRAARSRRSISFGGSSEGVPPPMYIVSTSVSGKAFRQSKSSAHIRSMTRGISFSQPAKEGKSQ